MVSVSVPTNCGPFFAGDSGPSLDLIFLWDTGGYVDITRSNIDVTVRRWDSRSKQPVGPVITSGPALIIDGLNGQASFQWAYADPLPNVPSDSGWYVLQARVLLRNGAEQASQRAVFEVLPA